MCEYTGYPMGKSLMKVIFLGYADLLKKHK